MREPLTIILPEALKKICVGRLYDDERRKLQPAVHDRITDGLGHGTYPAKAFYAYVWYAQGRYWAEVWQRKFHVATHSALTAEELVRELADSHNGQAA